MPADSKSVFSMTGFAALEHEMGGVRYRVEIRSLNHRFLDLKIKLPKVYQRIEARLRSEFQKSFNRGAVEFRVSKQVDPADEPAAFEPSLAHAAHYYEGLKRIQTILGLSEPIQMQDLLSFPDVISGRADREELKSDDELWNEIQPLVRESVDALKSTRSKEGRHTAGVLTERLEQLRELTQNLKTFRSRNAEAIKEKLTARIEEIFELHPVKSVSVKSVLESRIAQELAMTLDRRDIQEELDRLDGHLTHFSDTLSNGGAVGRKLDFLLQEIGREVNTLGSKSQDLGISQQVVPMKVIAEQLREQVMNLE